MIDVAEREQLRRIYAQTRTIAVVGASADDSKAAHQIPRYLQAQGYRIVPINPRADQLFGERVFRSLAEIDVPVDVVDVFRPADEAPEIARQAIAIGAKVIWLQLMIRFGIDMRHRQAIFVPPRAARDEQREGKVPPVVANVDHQHRLVGPACSKRYGTTSICCTTSSALFSMKSRQRRQPSCLSSARVRLFQAPSLSSFHSSCRVLVVMCFTRQRSRWQATSW